MLKSSAGAEPGVGSDKIRGKKMSKEETAKTPCIYHAKGKCRRGDKCFYKQDDKAAATTKDTKRTNSPAPKTKGKESNAARCLIGPNLIGPNPKFACIAKKQPRVTSSSDGSSVSMKRVGSERSWPSSPRHTSSKRVLSCVQNIR